MFMNSFLREHDDYKLLIRSNLLLLHDLMKFCKQIIIAMNTSQWAFFDKILLVVINIETNCCENMLITCFASCLKMWNVI
jgi:hypothetical protein